SSKPVPTAEVAVGKLLVGRKFQYFAFVHIGGAFVLAGPQDFTANLPVGLLLRTEKILSYQVGISKCFPNFFYRRLNGGLVDRLMICLHRDMVLCCWFYFSMAADRVFTKLMCGLLLLSTMKSFRLLLENFEKSPTIANAI